VYAIFPADVKTWFLSASTASTSVFTTLIPWAMSGRYPREISSRLVRPKTYSIEAGPEMKNGCRSITTISALGASLRKVTAVKLPPKPPPMTTTRGPEGAGRADMFMWCALDRAGGSAAAPRPIAAVLRNPRRSIRYVLMADAPFYSTLTTAFRGRRMRNSSSAFFI
jgi:hypothetical protein